MSYGQTNKGGKHGSRFRGTGSRSNREQSSFLQQESWGAGAAGEQSSGAGSSNDTGNARGKEMDLRRKIKKDQKYYLTDLPSHLI